MDCVIKMELFLFVLVLSGTLAAGFSHLLDQDKCTSDPCLIFEDNFDELDDNVWDHELSLWGGGNFEFQGYVKDSSISFTKNGKLFIKPKLLADEKGEGFLSSGTWNVCGSKKEDINCERTGNPKHIINPIMSARLQTQHKFAFKYGRVEVTVKMPKGDWLWPAIWMFPENSVYGGWPSSGEIDIVESRGNNDFGNLGNKYAGTTLHWGPSGTENRYGMTTKQYSSSSEAFTDGFHTWAFDWTPDYMKAYLDGKPVFSVDPGRNFWNFGNFSQNLTNPWASGGKMAPFDQPFYLIINLAVGGTNGYFPDGIDPAKPWPNNSPHAYLDFWNGRKSWLPTWQDSNGNISDDAALQVDSIKVFKILTPLSSPQASTSSCGALCSCIEIISLLLLFVFQFIRFF